MEGWISLHRKFAQWEWYDDLPVKVLFLHLLLKANHKDAKHRGALISRGQYKTGRHTLSKETGLTERQIRTALNKLKSTSEVTIKSYSKYSIITITNYDKYQSRDQQATSKRPASDQQATTNNNENNENNENKKERKPTSSHDFLNIVEFLISELPYEPEEEITQKPYIFYPDSFVELTAGLDAGELGSLWKEFVLWHKQKETEKNKHYWFVAWSENLQRKQEN